MPRRDVTYLKGSRFRDHLTLAELSKFLEDRGLAHDPSWIRALEKDNRIPKAQRVKRGKLFIRLWSPAQAEEIAGIIAEHRPGRPSNG